MKKFRYKDIPHTAPYYLNWLNYRQRNRRVIQAYIFSSFLILLAMAFNRCVWLSFVVLSLVLFVFGNYAIFWPCPRCRKPFHIDFGRLLDAFSSKCVHCGLPKWSPDDKNPNT